MQHPQTPSPIINFNHFSVLKTDERKGKLINLEYVWYIFFRRT